MKFLIVTLAIATVLFVAGCTTQNNTPERTQVNSCGSDERCIANALYFCQPAKASLTYSTEIGDSLESSLEVLGLVYKGCVIDVHSTIKKETVSLGQVDGKIIAVVGGPLISDAYNNDIYLKVLVANMTRTIQKNESGCDENFCPYSGEKV